MTGTMKRLEKRNASSSLEKKNNSSIASEISMNGSRIGIGNVPISPSEIPEKPSARAGFTHEPLHPRLRP